MRAKKLEAETMREWITPRQLIMAAQPRRVKPWWRRLWWRLTS